MTRKKSNPKRTPLFKTLEARLQTMFEGRLAHLLDGGLSPHTIAKSLTRALEDGLIKEAKTLVAPDQYVVALHPDVLDRLQSHYDGLEAALAERLLSLIYEERLHIKHHPVVRFVPDATLAPHEVNVRASHSRRTLERTQIMEPVDDTPDNLPPREAYLVLDNGQQVAMTRPIINVGRHRDNHIVLDNPSVSRHHCQLKLRFGRYIIYDLHSKAGTRVNGYEIQEHRLESGDTINLGNTQMVYLVYDPDEADGSHRAGDTQTAGDTQEDPASDEDASDLSNVSDTPDFDLPQ